MHQVTQINYNNYSDISKKIIPIAPALERKYFTIGKETEEIGIKKYNYKGATYGAQAASIARRNARERNRVKQVNDSFNALRRRLPSAVVTALSNGPRRGTGKKLSKVDTLRMVVEYIRHLEDLVKENDGASDCSNEKYSNEIAFQMQDDFDEGFLCGSGSPYSESIPSPTSEGSSGIYDHSPPMDCYGGSYQPSIGEQLSSPVEDHLLETISWWQQK